MTTITDLADFNALDPFFRIIEKGLDGIADGRHFFDLLADRVIFEYIITTPGYPRRVEGRTAVAELYRPYGTMIVLDRCHDLAVHHDRRRGARVAPAGMVRARAADLLGPRPLVPPGPSHGRPRLVAREEYEADASATHDPTDARGPRCDRGRRAGHAASYLPNSRH